MIMTTMMAMPMYIKSDDVAKLVAVVAVGVGDEGGKTAYIVVSAEEP